MKDSSTSRAIPTTTVHTRTVKTTRITSSHIQNDPTFKTNQVNQVSAQEEKVLYEASNNDFSPCTKMNATYTRPGDTNSAVKARNRDEEKEQIYQNYKYYESVETSKNNTAKLKNSRSQDKVRTVSNVISGEVSAQKPQILGKKTALGRVETADVGDWNKSNKYDMRTHGTGKSMEYRKKMQRQYQSTGNLFLTKVDENTCVYDLFEQYNGIPYRRVYRLKEASESDRIANPFVVSPYQLQNFLPAQAGSPANFAVNLVQENQECKVDPCCPVHGHAKLDSSKLFVSGDERQATECRKVPEEDAKETQDICNIRKNLQEQNEEILKEKLMEIEMRKKEVEAEYAEKLKQNEAEYQRSMRQNQLDYEAKLRRSREEHQKELQKMRSELLKKEKIEKELLSQQEKSRIEQRVKSELQCKELQYQDKIQNFQRQIELQKQQESQRILQLERQRQEEKSRYETELSKMKHEMLQQGCLLERQSEQQRLEQNQQIQKALQEQSCRFLAEMQKCEDEKAQQKNRYELELQRLKQEQAQKDLLMQRQSEQERMQHQQELAQQRALLENLQSEINRRNNACIEEEVQVCQEQLCENQRPVAAPIELPQQTCAQTTVQNSEINCNQLVVNKQLVKLQSKTLDYDNYKYYESGVGTVKEYKCAPKQTVKTCTYAQERNTIPTVSKASKVTSNYAQRCDALANPKPLTYSQSKKTRHTYKSNDAKPRQNYQNSRQTHNYNYYESSSYLKKKPDAYCTSESYKDVHIYDNSLSNSSTYKYKMVKKTVYPPRPAQRFMNTVKEIREEPLSEDRREYYKRLNNYQYKESVEKKGKKLHYIEPKNTTRHNIRFSDNEMGFEDASGAQRKKMVSVNTNSISNNSVGNNSIGNSSIGNSYKYGKPTVKKIIKKTYYTTQNGPAIMEENYTQHTQHRIVQNIVSNGIENQELEILESNPQVNNGEEAQGNAEEQAEEQEEEQEQAEEQQEEQQEVEEVEEQQEEQVEEQQEEEQVEEQQEEQEEQQEEQVEEQQEEEQVEEQQEEQVEEQQEEQAEEQHEVNTENQPQQIMVQIEDEHQEEEINNPNANNIEDDEEMDIQDLNPQDAKKEGTGHINQLHDIPQIQENEEQPAQYEDENNGYEDGNEQYGEAEEYQGEQYEEEYEEVYEQPEHEEENQ